MLSFQLHGLLLLILTSLSKGTPVPSDSAFIVKHSWSQIPKGWQMYDDPPSNHMLDLHIGLKVWTQQFSVCKLFLIPLPIQQSNIDAVIGHLYEVSDPAHPRYGQHLSKEEVDELVAPTTETATAVNEWLQSHGINSSHCHTSTAGDWLRITLPISKVESMFNNRYHIFRHEKTGENVLRALNWSLPSHLHEHIDVAAPTTSFARARPMKATSFLDSNIPIIETPEFSGLAVPPASCNTAITPSCLRTLYNTANYTPTATNVNQIGIAGYLEEFANLADLKVWLWSFFRAYVEFFLVDIYGKI